MKTRPLKNYSTSVGLEAYDVDFNNPEEVLALGKLVSEQCIVAVNQQIPTQKLLETMTSWGSPSQALIHSYVVQRKLNGRHWREILLNLGYVTDDIKDMASAVSMVSYKKGEKNRPKGIFSNGELDWHSDQCAFDDAPRIIGLQSVSDTVNSATQFLCTHDVYEGLSSDMRSMVKELVCKHKWLNLMAPGLNEVQSLIIQYNMVPLDGMETKLYTESVTGLSGIKFPSHSFDGFVGMSGVESNRVLRELKEAIYNDKYVHTQNWQDGQIVFMDQEITLHKRPTNILDGDLRTMARVITYWDKLYPEKTPIKNVRFDGEYYSLDDFCNLVDKDRKKRFELTGT